tara:strand:+ start:2022 stop:2276 length:255 start_codon:yes stop_codon:yes gene_type:complete
MIKLLLLFSLFLSEPQIVEVKIKGMVCSFCAQGLQKGIGKLEEVEKVEINLPKGYAKITVKKGEKLPMNKVEEIIKDAGYLIND